MDKIYSIAFKMICSVGEAKSCYIEAMQEARKGNIKKAEELIEKGRTSFIEGHEAHADLLKDEANGKNLEFSLLLLHAEDQLMSAEDFSILAKEYIELAKSLKLNKKE